MKGQDAMGWGVYKERELPGERQEKEKNSLRIEN